MELIGKLGIETKLLVAQLVNFLILFFILKRYVFGPVLRKLDERRAMIAKTVSDSKKAQESLGEVEKLREEMLEKTKSRAIKMLEEAANKAQETKESIMKSAQQEAVLLAEQNRLQMVREKERILKEAGEELAKLAVAAVSKIIEREFSPEDQKRLTSEALTHISR